MKMKHTNRSQIRRRIFKIEDLKRIARLFDEQARLARKSSHHYTVEYKIKFADDTSIEGDTPSLLDATAVQVKRPVNVDYYFYNYKLDRNLSFSITHGDSRYGNEFEIKSNDQAWLNDNYLRLEEFVNGTEEVTFWFIRHPNFLVHILALGVGSFFLLLFDILFLILGSPQLTFSNSGQELLEPLRAFIANNHVLVYLFGWILRWFVGFFWGAISLANWLTSAWPNIELDFGADHFKIEKKKRQKIAVVMTLIIAPICSSILLDIIKQIY